MDPARARHASVTPCKGAKARERTQPSVKEGKGGGVEASEPDLIEGCISDLSGPDMQTSIAKTGREALR